MNALDGLLTPAAQRRRWRRAHLADQHREADVTTLHDLPPDHANWANGTPHKLETALWRIGPGGATSIELAILTGRRRQTVAHALRDHPRLFERIAPAAGTRPAVWTLRPQDSPTNNEGEQQP